MNKIDIANGLIFQKMEIHKSTFDERLICQKKIYLLQALGTNLGYSYNWYVRGPYSPELTNYIYNNLDVLSSNDFSSYELAEVPQKNVNKVNGLINEKPDNMSSASWYELLASLLYMDKNRKSWGIDEGDDKQLYSKLMQYKPKYNIDECDKAYNLLKAEKFVEMEG